MEEQRIQAYGKINLSLDVRRKRPDGYHDVCMVMHTVKLCDEISLKREKTPGIHLSSNLDFLPRGEDNLMVKAAKLLADEFSIREGLSFHLEKRIPVSGGMAGGSTDAAAVLHLMNRIYALGLSIEDLEKRGVKLGADVPFCLHRGCYLSEGIGEILTPQDLSDAAGDTTAHARNSIDFCRGKPRDNADDLIGNANRPKACFLLYNILLIVHVHTLQI